MKSLSCVESGQHCRVKWMIGQVAEDIRNFCRIREDDTLDVVSNCGGGFVIVSYGGHRYALNDIAAFSIKVDEE